MLLITILVLSVITLRKFNSPFSEVNLSNINKLEEKAKFDEAQIYTQKLMDSTFSRIDKLDPQKSSMMEEHDVKVGIETIGNAFKNTSYKDPRKEGYAKIAKFYSMYQVDKQTMKKTINNIELNEKRYDACKADVNAKLQNMN